METIITRSGFKVTRKVQALRSHLAVLHVREYFSIFCISLCIASLISYSQLALLLRSFERVMPSEAIRVNWRNEFFERELSYFLYIYSRVNKVETSTWKLTWKLKRPYTEYWIVQTEHAFEFRL